MVYIKELLPNPVGNDKDGEWIKLINTGDEITSIGKWKIFDVAEKTFIFNANQELPAGGEITLDYALTKITLNNDGDTITLVNNKGEVVDALTYSGQVGDDEIITAEAFLEITQETLQNPSLENLAFVGQGQLVSGAQITPFLVAIALAVTLGIIAGFLGKMTYER